MDYRRLNAGLLWPRCLVYIDDILTFGKDFDGALTNFNLILQLVQQYGLQLKSTNCLLFQTEVPFLGHIMV